MSICKRICVACVTALLLLAGCTKPASTDIPEPAVLVIAQQGLPSAALGEVIRTFEARNDGVTVQVRELSGPVFLPNRPITDEMIEQQFGGVDIVIGSYLWLGSPLQYRGMLRDLGALEHPEPDPLVSEYLQGLGYVEGHRVYLPLRYEPQMFYLNEQVIRDLGLEVPGPDWTYAELEHLLRELKAAGYQARVRLPRYDLVLAVMHSYGGQHRDEASERWELNTVENRAALGFLERLFQDGLLGTGPEMLRPDYADPRGAVLFTSDVSAPGYRALPYPAGPVRRSSFTVQGVDAMLLSTSAQPGLALRFLTDLLSPDIGAVALARAGVRPLVRSPEAVRLWREQVGDERATAHDLALGSLFRYVEEPSIYQIPRALLHALESGSDTEQALVELEYILNQSR